MHLLLILGLESFTEYQVSIAALTELGMGPYSPPVLVKTLENGELVVFTFLNFKCKFRDHILLITSFIHCHVFVFINLSHDPLQNNLPRSAWSSIKCDCES